MNSNYLSREEDTVFSEKVITFNRTPENLQNNEERSLIKERTKILIYKIATELLHLSRDEASSVYVDMNRDLDTIITSYRVSAASYNQYIRQLCQYRIRRLRREQCESDLWEDAFLMEESYTLTYNLTADHLEMPIEKKEYPPPESNFSYSTMNILSIYEYIVQNRDNIRYPLYNEKEKKLKRSLEDAKVRKRFLMLLLFVPKESDGTDSFDLARVLQTNERAVVRFLELKDEKLSEDRSRHQDALERANKHWRIMARLRKNISYETNVSRRKALQDQYQTQVRCHRNRMEEAKKAVRGMSRTEIAYTLGVSRTTVSNSIEKITELLKEITAEEDC